MILYCWKILRNVLNGSSPRTLIQFITLPFLVLTVVISCNVAYGKEQKIVDLTWDFNEKTLYWLGIQPFNFTEKNASFERGYWYASNEFQAGEQGGTHLDAPYHFNKEGWKVSDIPINRLFSNAILVDFSSEVEAEGPDYTVDTKLLETKLRAFEPIKNNTVLLIKFGWSKYWPDRKNYMGLDHKQVGHFPGLDKSSATLIAKDERIIGVGVDTASVDVGITKTYDAHRILLGRNIYILENTKMTDQFPDRAFTLLVAPMKLTEGSGAPTRIFAVYT